MSPKVRLVFTGDDFIISLPRLDFARAATATLGRPHVEAGRVSF